MDVMSLRILCWAGLKHVRCCQSAGKYVHDFKKAHLNAGAHVEMRFDVTSILEVGWCLEDDSIVW